MDLHMYDWEGLDTPGTGSQEAAQEGLGYDWDTVPKTAGATKTAAEKEEAEDELINVLLHLNKNGQLTAKAVCTISYWCSQAGLEGLEPLALAPDQAGGNFQRRLDKFMRGTYGTAKELYEPCIPCYSRGLGERVSMRMPMLPPHQIVAELTGSELAETMETLKPPRAVPEVYLTHPVVVESEAEPVVPLALFVDGLTLRKNENMLAITFQGAFGGFSPKLSVGVRKRFLCQCGCAGWCTLNAVFSILRWSLSALKCGVWPEKQHDGSDWPLDSPFKERAGQQLPRACLVQLRADLAEYSHTLGLPSVASGPAPCCLCTCNHEQMLKVDDLTDDNTVQFEQKDYSSMDDACSRCEIEVQPSTEEEWKLLHQNLHSDRRKQGSRGLALKKNLPELGLKKNDRFEPSPEVPDWAAIYADPASRPTVLLFWRRTEETYCRHRNPLFHPDLGTELDRIVACDAMHTLTLGIQQQFIAAAMHKIMRVNLFQSTASAREQRNLENMSALNVRLFKWYRTQNAASLTKVDQLKVEAFGKADKQACHYKAAESLWLLRWLAAAMPSFPDFEGKALFVDSACQLNEWWTSLQVYKYAVPEFVVQDTSDMPRSTYLTLKLKKQIIVYGLVHDVCTSLIVANQGSRKRHKKTDSQQM
eukprot:6456129-Amphidinium_carterae.3